MALSSSLIAIIKPTQLNTGIRIRDRIGLGIRIGPGGRNRRLAVKIEKTSVGTTNIIHDFLHIPSGWFKIRWQNQLFFRKKKKLPYKNIFFRYSF